MVFWIVVSHTFKEHPSLKRDMVKFEFGRVHKTLQQSIVRTIIVPILERLAEDYEKGCYDDRNEASVRFAKQSQLLPLNAYGV